MAEPLLSQLRSMRTSVAAPNERSVPAVAEAVHREMHAAMSPLDRFLGRRLACDKPFEELVAFDPVFV